MGHGVESLLAEQFIHARLVEEVAADEPRRRGDGLDESVLQTVEHHHVVPFGEQLLGDDAADEARPAGD